MRSLLVPLLFFPAMSIAQPSPDLIESGLVKEYKIAKITRTKYNNHVDSVLLVTEYESFDQAGRKWAGGSFETRGREKDTFIYAKRWIYHIDTSYISMQDKEELFRCGQTKMRYYRERRFGGGSDRGTEIIFDSLGRLSSYHSGGFNRYWTYDVKGRIVSRRSESPRGKSHVSISTDSLFYNEKDQLIQEMTYSGVLDFTEPADRSLKFEGKGSINLREGVWYTYNDRGLRSAMITSSHYTSVEPTVYRYYYTYSFYDQ